MDGLRAAAAKLERAVKTVAAAAEQLTGQQPSDDLVHTCYVAVYALLSAHWVAGTAQH